MSDIVLSFKAVTAKPMNKSKKSTSFGGITGNLAIVLGTQLLSGALVMGGATAAMELGRVSVPLVLILILQGVGAAWLGLRMGLSRFWGAVQFILPMAVYVGLRLPIPSWVYLALFVATGLVFWNAAGERVPLYLTNKTTWKVLARFIADKPGTRFIDLGCGLGGLIIHLARNCPQSRISGIESAPIPFIISWFRKYFSGLNNLVLEYGNYWVKDLSGYDVVYCFLSPVPMTALFDKARAEMKPGSLFISNSFPVVEIAPDQTFEVEDSRNTHLYVWRI
ncbi:MAG: hypothetical protein OEY85_07725 [Rhodospirillales bacterium]|nr:hypothetical protein [Rhodospirillales bacterium]